MNGALLRIRRKLLSLLWNFLVFFLGFFLHRWGSLVLTGVRAGNAGHARLDDDINSAEARVKKNRQLSEDCFQPTRILARPGDRVIALAGSNIQPFAANPDFDGVVILGAIVASRVVAERVLVTGLLGHAGVETLKRIALRGVKHVAAGVMSVGLQAREFPVVEPAADSKAVHGNAVAKKVLDCIVVRVAIAFAILTVGDKKNHFAPFAPAVLQELCGFIDGVVQSLCGFFANDCR